MPNCIVRGCIPTRKKRDPSVILHGFPREPEKIKLWLQQTGQYDADLDNMVVKVYLGKVNDSYRMCSLHFTNDSYHYDGYRRILKKNAVPTIFNTITQSSISLVTENISSLPGLPNSSSEHQTASAPPANNREPSCFGRLRKSRAKLAAIHPKTTSQPTIQQMTLVPVVPQHVFFQACEISQEPNQVVGDRSVTIQPASNTVCEATQISALSGVSQQSSVSRPSSLSVLEVPVSSSVCIQQSTSAISEFRASSHSGQLEKLTPANLQQTTLFPTTFVQEPSSILTNSNLPLNTQLKPEATDSSTKTPSSTTSFCPIISLPTSSTPVISTSGSDKSPYKTMSAPSIPIPLTVLSETKPRPIAILPASGTVSSVTQTPKTSGLAQKPSSISVVQIPLKSPTSQPIKPGCQPPSKKRKLEENTVLLEKRGASSSVPSTLPSHCMSQTSINTGNIYFVSSSTPLVQPSYLIQKPLMIDKGVNTDSFTNRKSCCVATDPMHGKRNARTQTKIYKKDRKIMCTLLVSGGQTNHFNESSMSRGSTDDIGFSDCSPSRSSDSGDEPSDVLETVNLDLVKVEIFSNREVDVCKRTTLDHKQAIRFKDENDSSAGQAVLFPTPFKSALTLPDFDINTMKIEPNIKTEEDQFPVSGSIQNITNFVSYKPKIERTSPNPSEPLDRISWETSAIQTDDELEDLNDSSFYINEMSEDEDESFLLPSDAEDEDDIKPVFQDLDSPVENPVEEEKYIVFESCLKKLIMMIPCMSETKCMSPLTQYRKATIGSYLSIEVRCRSGHTRLLWESQPRHGYQPMGNVLLSAAVLFSGSSFLKSQHMFKLLNLKSIDKSTYYKTQSMYLFPTINHHWKEEQKAVIQSVQERPLCLAGDQQLDNPGFSAKYSTYSLIDVASKKICSFSVQPVIPQVTLEGLEKIGFQKSMGELQTMNAEVKMIVTDRSVAIQEILKDHYPGIIHQLDLWHLSKSIGHEVLMAAKREDCEILYQWVEAIRNHIWWSFCTCCKNPDLFIEKWKSVLQHVTNVHEWGGDSDCKACHHPPLPEEVVNNTNWLKKDSTAHEQLKKIVENVSLLKDLKRLSFFCHTGELEIYHITCLKYRPKMLHFFLDSMVARTQLAALDHNRNVCMLKELVKNTSRGNALSAKTQGLEVFKGQKSWIIKALYKPTCQRFLVDIMKDVIALVREEKIFQ
ncbi:uncharacterized protein LOC122920189 [Bufo gargarizans]|uniref:uncharacterized protein LOC122920189 n=1 Tax=Bufo gargarizans TaxID=30331 RepID=UPI001CF0DE55|nr:uncharacterized protein LOC122920189 [Bufo gargarizans]